jgi:hypothetical protein
MSLPNALYLGAAKAGSSWIEQRLRAHPDAYVCDAKDTYFFCRDEVFGRGIGWYADQFKRGSDHRVRIEVCHDYLHSPVAPARINAFLGSPKFVVSLRKPSDRAVSAYAYATRHHDLPPFEEALYQRTFLADECRYATHLRRYLSHFPVASFLILDFADLQRDGDLVWRNIVEFLDLPRMPLDDDALRSVRSRSSARSRAVAKLGKRGAKLLRRTGREDVLGRIKRSRVIERVLYREEGGRFEVDPSVLQEFDEAMRPEVEEVDRLFGTSLAASWRLTDRGSS